MTMPFNEYTGKITASFFSFWVKRWRFTFLLTALLVFLGTNAMIAVPKESSPEIEFGIISITTVYPGTNPIDMDSLITEKIEAEIENIAGIKKITSTSNVGVSSVLLELETDVDIQGVLLDVRDAVDKVAIPADATDPVITELSTSNELLFELVLYGDRMTYASDTLMNHASRMQRLLEQSSQVAGVNYGGLRMGGRSSQRIIPKYDLVIRLNQYMLQELGLSVQQIAQTIRATNVNQPLGRFEIDNKGYDVRIENQYKNIDDVMNTVIIFNGNTQVLLKDIAYYDTIYDDTAIRSFGLKDELGNNAVMLTINKKAGENIFKAAKKAKAAIEDAMASPEFAGLSYAITNDLSAVIIEDYKNLGNSARQTLLIVFLCVIFFVGWREAAIATMSLPLSFFITFLVLQYLGLSLNFLTNFSLVLTLGIIIDIAVVLIEAASERVKLGFSSQTAMLMAIRDFAAPLISGTATTIVVFIPLLTLPGLIGKFLAYIPITVFATLVAALLIGMLVTPAIFVQLFKKFKTYTPDEQIEKFLTQHDKDILATEREGKVLREEQERTWRENAIHTMGNWYAGVLRSFITNPKLRKISIVAPIIALILTLVFLSPRIGFTLFPAGDNGTFTVTATYPVGTTTDAAAEALPLIEHVIAGIDELKSYSLQIANNLVTIRIDLREKKIRNKEGLRNVFEVEEHVLDQLSFLVPQGVSIDSAVQAGGPPQGKPVGIKLIAEQNTQFPVLIQVAKDFEAYVRTLPGVINVTRSSSDVPGQFVYRMYNEYLQFRGISVGEVAQSINATINGWSAGTIAIDGDDVKIRLQIDEFVDKTTPKDLDQLVIPTRTGPIKITEVMDYSLESAVGAVSRDNTNITITVEADVDDLFRSKAGDIQQQLQEFAASYQFPTGLRYEAAGEGAENAELISATALGFLVAIIMIFAILVLEFNSYVQPMIILYSVVMGMIGINIGLYLTGTPYSMSFAIGLIAMTGIVVDNAVVLLERVNENIKHAVDDFEAIIEAGRSRLAPIMLTSLTDTLGLVPIAFQDPFWQGLSFTIGFGLITGSVMTLFVVPSIYYLVLMRKKRKNVKHLENNEPQENNSDSVLEGVA